jgi:hypothetical protein
LDRKCNIKPNFPAEAQPLLTTKKVSATAKAATAPPPQAAVFFLFSTKGPFQGHTLPFQGIIHFFLHLVW